MTERGHNWAIPRMSLHRRPRIGLALGGGGARGLAHIGVLQTLQRAGIPVDCLAGTSMGAVIAAGYAAGMSPAELEQEATAATRLHHLLSLADAGVPDGGLLRGRRLMRYFERCLRQTSFADLHLPLAVVAVDLNTRREVVLREGPVALALRATTAVPGLFAPLELDGQRLVDGGLLNNLPVDVVRQMGAQVVIAVDVTATAETSFIGWAGDHRWVPGKLTETLRALEDAMGTLVMAAEERKLCEYPPDVLIRPTAPPGVGVLTGYHRVAELVACGESAAQAALPQIQAAARPRRLWPVRSQARPARQGTAGAQEAIPLRQQAS